MMANIKKYNKVLIMAGGTGGHVFPALTIAQYLIEKGVEVEWLGTRNGLEAKVIGETDIPLHFISISGLRGKSVWKKLMAPLFILTAIFQAILKVLSIKPACVLGMGGFVTGPGGVAAWLLGKKLLIHEQNAIAGFTNQLLFPLASVVMEAFPGAFMRKQEMTGSRFLKSFIKKDKAIHVGNPVRKEISLVDSPVERYQNRSGKLRMLVIGGSLGAVALNEIIPETLAALTDEEAIEVRHQCGARNLKQTQGFYQKNNVEIGEGVAVEPFITDMAAAYSWADLIVCRSGAITVSEIAAIGLPSILVPYPYAVDDHQTENARALVKHDAAWLIDQKDLGKDKLVEIIKLLTEQRELLLEKGNAAQKAGLKDATERAGGFCLEACYA